MGASLLCVQFCCLGALIYMKQQVFLLPEGGEKMKIPADVRLASQPSDRASQAC